MEAQDPAPLLQESDAIQETRATEALRLVSGVLGKDRKVTAEFVGLCADWIYPFVRRRLVPRTDLVEDLTQEIVLAAWQSLATFRGGADLRSWVMGIARHKVDDYYRKSIREMEIPEDDENVPELAVTPGFEQHLDSAAQHERVQKTLSLIPEAYAAALIWRYRDEKSVMEMAQITGKTPKAMERLLARARETFRRRWSDAGV